MIGLPRWRGPKPEHFPTSARAWWVSIRQHAAMEALTLLMVVLWLITMWRMTSLQDALKKLREDGEHINRNIDSLSASVQSSQDALIELVLRGNAQAAAALASSETLPPPRRGKP